MPLKPRIKWRRRGSDFFANFHRALEPAFDGWADIVLHGGDLFFRSRVAPAIVERALRPLMELANAGVAVYIVPGNHERSSIPAHLWTAHPNLHIFHKPCTFYLRVNGLRVGLSGFPFNRQIGLRFSQLLEQTGYLDESADVHLLCLHQSVEGARVGPNGFTFRPGPEVIAGQQLPSDMHAVLSGHIHRSQQLSQDINGCPLPAPVIYPGSIERTSFAERHEDKHYVKVEIDPRRRISERVRATFVPVPARPMVVLRPDRRVSSTAMFELWLQEALTKIDPNSVVRIDLDVNLSEKVVPTITSARIRELAFPSMNITLRYRGN